MQYTHDQFRLFISSTFKDMDKERSYLVEWIFPRIKALCEARGVEFFPIDLRWGITEDAGKEGRIISACIEEVDNSRPFFIGLVGDRYGWRPTTEDLGPTADSLIKRYPWLKDDLEQHMSITEIEMQYGALRNPNVSAAFYIREQKNQSSSLARWWHEFRSPDERSLRRLKQAIRANSHVQNHSYESLEQLGEQVYADLKAVVERQFSADLSQQQANHHHRSYYDHLKNYVDLSSYHKRMEQALERLTDERRFLILCGIKGTGKSTVLCTFLQQYMSSHPEVDVYYFDMRKIMQGQELSVSAHKDYFEWQPFKMFFVNFLIHLLAKLLESKAKQILLVFDNAEYLDVADHAEFIEIMKKSRLLENVRVLLTHEDYRFNPYYKDENDVTESYRFVDELQGERIEVTGIDRKDIPHYVEQYMRQYGKTFSTEQLGRFSLPLYASMPHYLNMALFQLVEFGSFEKVDDEIGYLTGETAYANNEKLCLIHSLFTPVIYTLENTVYRHIAESVEMTPLIMICWLMFQEPSGLSEREIIDIFDLNPAAWALYRPQLMVMCREQNGYIAFQDNLFDLVLGRITEEKQDLAHQKIIAYCEQFPWQYEYIESCRQKDPQWRATPEDKQRIKETLRKAKLLPKYYVFTKQFDKLRACLADERIRRDIPSWQLKWLQDRLNKA